MAPNSLYRNTARAESKEARDVARRAEADRENIKQRAKTAALLETLEKGKEFDGLAAEIRTMNSLLGDFKALASRPVELKTPAAPKTAKFAKPNVIHAAAIAAELKRRLDHTSPEDFIASVYKGPENRLNRDRVSRALKSMTDPASTTDANFGHILTSTMLGEWFSVKDATTIVSRLSKVARAIPFNGANAVTIPRRGATRTLDAAFIQEAATFPVKQDQYGSSTLNRFKMGVISTLSNEIMRVSRPEIVGLVEDAILTDTAEAIDGFMFDAESASAGVRPAGLLSGVVPVASSGNSIENVLTDLRYLLGEMIAIRARKPVILINPLLVASLSLKTTTGTGISPFKDDLERGTLGGIPYIAASTMPVDEVYALDADSLFIGIDAPEVDFSNSASLVMLNDDGIEPTMSNTGAINETGAVHISDAATVAGGPAQVQSLFQTFSTAMRYVQPISWGTARPNILAALNGVGW